MRKLLLSCTALAALSFVTPASATFVVLSAPDADDVKMFLNDTGTPTTEFFGSTTGNGSHSTDSVKVNTLSTVTTASGFATIKPVVEGTLTSLLFTPNMDVTPPFLFDGFFTRGQLEYTGDKALKFYTVFMDVNGGIANAANGGVTFAFNEDPTNKHDFEFIGFDEPQKIIGYDNKGKPIYGDDESKASIINTVKLYTTTEGLSFFEVKQMMWSPCVDGGGCGVVINPTSGVPELSTWFMMILGFAGVGLAGMRKARNSFRWA